MLRLSETRLCCSASFFRLPDAYRNAGKRNAGAIADSAGVTRDSKNRNSIGGYGIAITFRLLLAFSLCGSSAWADSATDSWRSALAAARTLADNDAPAAYKEALHLQAILPADATPSDRVKLLNLLSRIEVYRALTYKAAAHAQQALDLAKVHDDKIGQAEADLNLIMNLTNQGRLDAMFNATTHGMTVLEGVDRPDLLSEAMLRTAMMYRRMGMIDDSVTMTMQAMEIARHSGDPVALLYAHQGMAFSFDLSGRSEEALEHFMRMKEQARAVHSLRMEGEALQGLGKVTGQLGDNASSERLIREAIGIYRKIGNVFLEAQGLYALAENLTHQHSTADVLPLLDQAIAIYEQHPNKIGMWWVLNARSEHYQLLGLVDKARADAERAYRLARNIGFPLYMSESAKRLAAIAAAAGDHAQAYKLSIEADEMTAKAAGERAGTRMIELAKRYEAESQRRQLDKLSRLNERQAATLLQNELHQRWWITLAGSSFVVLSATVFFLLRLRRSHRQLQHSRSNQQAILDAIPDLLFELDLDGRYYDCQSICPELLPVPIEDMLGKTLSEVMPQEVADIYLSALHEAYEIGISTGKQYSLPVPQGLGWFELSVARKAVRRGEMPRFIALSRDITERKTLEDAVRESAREFRTLADNLPELIVRYDRDLRCSYLNPAYERLTGVSPKMAQNKTAEEFWSCLAPHDEYTAWLRRVKETGGAQHMLLECHGPDGRAISHEMLGVAERDEEGHVVGVLVMGHNITELKATERHLQESRAQLRALTAKREEEREQERKRIAREIHDELGQLLSVMRIHAVTLDYCFGDIQPGLRDKTDKMIGTVDRALLMVRNLTARLRPEALRAGIIPALEWLVQEYAENTGIHCVLHVDGGDLPMDEDRGTAVFRIVQESLTNVLRYSEAERVEISLCRAGEICEVTVSDNGKGFDIADVANRNSFGIVGMRERALALGGELDIASAPGEGAVLRLRLPLVEFAEV